VRIPVPDTATGQTSRWCKLLSSVAERAKTGNDWTGDWLEVGKLADLEVGSLIVVGGSTGSRKYGVKTGQLYVVDPDGTPISISYVESNEWAVKQRETARKFLALPLHQRPIEAARRRAAMVREQALATADYPYPLNDTCRNNAASNPEKLDEIDAGRAAHAAELESQAQVWDRRAEELQAMLTPESDTVRPDRDPETVAAELALYSIEELEREIARRRAIG
jgi:hypothetical protein